MTNRTRELAPELHPLNPIYCPRCGRADCRDTPAVCSAYRAHMDRSLDAAFARHMANVAAVLFLEKLHRDVLEDERQHPLR